MGADEKHEISHRGRALRELAGLLSAYLPDNERP
jgi:inosine/xanthosine triphosphate pyrophosphatase family protein